MTFHIGSQTNMLADGATLSKIEIMFVTAGGHFPEMLQMREAILDETEGFVQVPK